MPLMRIGSDEVVFEGTRILIHARHPIRDWSVREFCRHAIHFRGQKYFLLTSHPSRPPFAACYELAAWPTDLHEESSVSFIYDAMFVARRDAQFRTERRRTATWYALLPLYPVLGLCWSGFKERVLGPVGFEPRSITSASVMLTFCVLVCEGIFYGWLNGGLIVLFTGRSFDWFLHDWPDALLLVVLFADCLMRGNELMQADVTFPSGTLEWLCRRKKQADGEGGD